MAAIPFLCLTVMAGAWVIILSLCAFEMEASGVVGPVPKADYQVRRSWGEKNLHHHFARVDQWIRQSKQIEADVGKVLGVAPIGSPNTYHAGFGESWAQMNLQVIGESGEGILSLSDVCADDPNKIYGVYVNEQTWTFSSTTEANQPQSRE